MTLKLSQSDLEALLREPGRDTRPPPDLLARLRADLPAELPLELPAAERAEESRRPSPLPFWRRPLLAFAATLAVLAVGTFLASRTFREAPVPNAPSREKAIETQEAFPVAKPQAAEAGTTLEDDRLEKAKKLELPALSAPSGVLEEPRVQEELTSREVKSTADGAHSSALQWSPPQKEAVPTARPGILTTESAAAPLQAAPEAALADAAEEGEKTAEGAFAADEVGAFEIAPRSEAPMPVLESPTVEGNTSIILERMPAPSEKARQLEDSRELENPSRQGDVGRRDAAWAAGRATPAAKIPEPGGIDASSAYAKQPSEPWQVIERTLAGGRWPSQEEIAAARPPLELGRSTAKKDLRYEADKVAQLQDDALSFLGGKDQSRSGLFALRRRAIRLAAKYPQDPRPAALLRSLNLAEKILPQ